MKILDIENMDKDEKELYQMLTSKFNETEMMKLMPLMVIDSEKYHREKLNNNVVLGDVNGSLNDLCFQHRPSCFSGVCPNCNK